MHAPVNQVNEQGDLRRFRIETPNVIDDFSLTPYAYRLYSSIKRSANSEEDRKCKIGSRKLAERCKMSLGQLAKAKAELVQVGLIHIEEIPTGHGAMDAISVVDVWEENVAIFSRKNERSKQLEMIAELKRSLYEHPLAAASRALMSSRSERMRSYHEQRNERIRNERNNTEDSLVASSASLPSDAPERETVIVAANVVQHESVTPLKENALEQSPLPKVPLKGIPPAKTCFDGDEVHYMLPDGSNTYCFLGIENLISGDVPEQPICSGCAYNLEEDFTEKGKLDPAARTAAHLSLFETLPVPVPPVAANVPSVPVGANGQYRAITVERRWAEKIARGEKVWEVRNFRPGYTGPLVITISKEKTAYCIVDVIGATDTRNVPEITSEEACFGTWAWKLENPRFCDPIKTSGRLGIWKWSGDLPTVITRDEAERLDAKRTAPKPERATKLPLAITPEIKDALAIVCYGDKDAWKIASNAASMGKTLREIAAFGTVTIEKVRLYWCNYKKREYKWRVSQTRPKPWQVTSTWIDYTSVECADLPVTGAAADKNSREYWGV